MTVLVDNLPPDLTASALARDCAAGGGGGVVEGVSKFLSIAQTANLLGVKGDHVTRLIERGELEAVDLAIGKRKRCLRISTSSVLSLVQARRVNPRTFTPPVPARRSLPPGVQRFCG